MVNFQAARHRYENYMDLYGICRIYDDHCFTHVYFREPNYGEAENVTGS